MPELRIALEPASLMATNSAEAPAIANQSSVRHIIAGAFLLSLFWGQRLCSAGATIWERDCGAET